jgi:integrase
MARFVPTFQCWSAEELHRFLVVADGNAHFALWRLAASTGMRRGEVLGLRWQDVDLEHRLVTVRRQLIRDGDALAFGHPKTAAGRRTICIDTNTALALEQLRVRQAALRDGGRLASGRADDLVFCRANGLPRDPDAVSHQFAELIGRAGLPRIRFHDLRHTHATMLCGPRSIQRSSKSAWATPA